MTTLNPIRVKRIGPNLIEEWSADKQLVILTAGDGEHLTIDTWAQAVKTVIGNWPRDRACLLLHDLHRCGFRAFDANMQEKFLELHNFKAGVNRHTALVMPDGFTAEVAQLFVKVQDLGVSRNYPIRWEVFLTRKNALRWLKSLADTPASR